MMLKEIWNKNDLHKLTAMLFLAVLIAFIPPEKGVAGVVRKDSVDSLGYYQRATLMNWELMQIRIKKKNNLNQ